MSGYSSFEVWIIILGLGVGTFLIRYSFLGMIGDRNIPDWALRYLRYTAVAVMPGLVAPLVVWPSATSGQPDPARLMAATVAIGVGVMTRNTLAAIIAGMVTLYGALYWLA